MFIVIEQEKVLVYDTLGNVPNGKQPLRRQKRTRITTNPEPVYFVSLLDVWQSLLRSVLCLIYRYML